MNILISWVTSTQLTLNLILSVCLQLQFNLFIFFNDLVNGRFGFSNLHVVLFFSFFFITLLLRTTVLKFFHTTTLKIVYSQKFMIKNCYKNFLQNLFFNCHISNILDRGILEKFQYHQIIIIYSLTLLTVTSMCPFLLNRNSRYPLAFTSKRDDENIRKCQKFL